MLRFMIFDLQACQGCTGSQISAAHYFCTVKDLELVDHLFCKMYHLQCRNLNSSYVEANEFRGNVSAYALLAKLDKVLLNEGIEALYSSPAQQRTPEISQRFCCSLIFFGYY